ncbi:hypothetical protein [Sinosporangium siamense]|uniref:Uncharacterized protein n=1 Tax=Sinosporangium siamense TaxID=1367973 RepID=A0A919RE89_9ACTN|nr:hypothetical protein [Sinosporangium siamense]GII92018.1 hypothetical protein Ssi02_22490 [Sinosporangium siamense]
MGGWRTPGRLSLVCSGWVLGLAFLAGPAAFAAAPDPAQDAQLVFCLSPAQRDPLLIAAVNLGIASEKSGGNLKVHGKWLTVDQWRKEHKEPFDRACAALRASSPGAAPPEGGGGAPSGWLGVLVPVAFGAVLTLASTEWRVASDRRRREADLLMARFTAFREAYAQQLHDWTDNDSRQPDPVMTRARHADLLSQILLVGGMHKRCGEPAARLRVTLEGELRVIGYDDWLAIQSSGHNPEPERIRAALATFERDNRLLADLVAGNGLMLFAGAALGRSRETRRTRRARRAARRAARTAGRSTSTTRSTTQQDANPGNPHDSERST